MIERIAVVTGGLSGIGLESAKTLQKSGHKIIIDPVDAEVSNLSLFKKYWVKIVFSST